MSIISHALAVLLVAAALAPAVPAIGSDLPEPGEVLPPHIQCHISIFGVCVPHPPPLVCVVIDIC